MAALAALASRARPARPRPATAATCELMSHPQLESPPPLTAAALPSPPRSWEEVDADTSDDQARQAAAATPATVGHTDMFSLIHSQDLQLGPLLGAGITGRVYKGEPPAPCCRPPTCSTVRGGSSTHSPGARPRLHRAQPAACRPDPTRPSPDHPSPALPSPDTP